MGTTGGLATGLALFILLSAGRALAQEPARERPNFLIIVADDLGFSDIGAFGGEIHTPNLDKLVEEGVQFTNFHTSVTCSPSRAMLLTGTENSRAGLGTMAETLAPNQRGQKGYEGYLNFDVVSLAEVMLDAGYVTSMVGKWHLGLEEEQGPAARGFQRSYALLLGGGGHFDQSGLAAFNPKALYREDGALVDLPEDFHSTEFFTDKAIVYLEEARGSGQPFLSYLAYTAPHWPLQTTDDLIAKYEPLYMAGYGEIYARRLEKAKARGVVPADVVVDQSFPGYRKWDDLSDEEKRREARRMAIYAGMVETLDAEVGRLMRYLEDSGQRDNTYIIFLSDNGPEGHDYANEPWLRNWLEHFDNSFENMGRRNSYIWQGADWAHVSAAPFRLFKGLPAVGGVRVPAFVNKPGLPVAGQATNALVSIKDVMPTLLDIAAVPHPETFKGRTVLPMTGHSFKPLLAGEPYEGTPDGIGWAIFGTRAYIQDGWKALFLPKPYGRGEWELYDLTADPGEAQDLAAVEPERLKQLIARWETYVRDSNVIFPDRSARY